MQDDAQFIAMQRGKVATEAMALIEEHLIALEQSVDNKIYSSLGNTLDPLDAVRWATEKAAYHRLAKRLQIDQTKGATARAELTRTMETHDA